MKKVLFGLGLMALAVVLANVSFAGKEGEKETSPEMEAYMKQYMQAIEPGKHHEAFKYRVGEWTAVVKQYSGPGMEPTISNSKCTYELVLDGRFLTQQMEGEVMGMPFVGMGFSGFDKTRGKHTMYWVDNLGTQSVYSEGECSDHCMKESYTFTTFDPLSGAESKIKTVTLIKNENEHVFEWYQVQPDGQSFKSMEIVYTRVSG